MTWLPYPLPPQCKIIITSARSDSSYRVLSGRADTKVVKVPLLTDTATRKEVICEYLAIHCKCLTDQQLEKVVSCKLSDRPLFLSALANELRVFGVNSHLDYHLDSYLETGSMQEVWSRIIQRWIKDYSWTTTRSGSSSLATNADGGTVGKSHNHNCQALLPKEKLREDSHFCLLYIHVALIFCFSSLIPKQVCVLKCYYLYTRVQLFCSF